MPPITLYFSPGACSIAPQILLHETCTPYTPVPLSVRAGLPPDFRAVNPKLRVPVLLLGDQTITETPAILTAIAQLAPADAYLLGTSDLATVRVYEWLNWLSGTLHGQGFGGLFRPQRFSDDPTTYASIKAKARKTVEECFAKIEADLSGSSAYAVGDGFTVVDPYLYVFYRWGAAELRMKMEESYPRYTAVMVELTKRPAFRAAVEVEGADNTYLPKL